MSKPCILNTILCKRQNRVLREKTVSHGCYKKTHSKQGGLYCRIKSLSSPLQVQHFCRNASTAFLPGTERQTVLQIEVSPTNVCFLQKANSYLVFRALSSSAVSQKITSLKQFNMTETCFRLVKFCAERNSFTEQNCGANGVELVMQLFDLPPLGLKCVRIIGVGSCPKAQNRNFRELGK